MTPEEFWAIWQQGDPEIKPVFYRLYYNDNGEPLFYSMEDLPGNYIEIDHETFARCPSNVRVVDGKLKKINTSTIDKLVPSDYGTCCDPRNICIVVSEEQPHQKWSIKKYVPN
jgi:hypothetical protein